MQHQLRLLSTGIKTEQNKQKLIATQNSIHSSFPKAKKLFFLSLNWVPAIFHPLYCLLLVGLYWNYFFFSLHSFRNAFRNESKIRRAIHSSNVMHQATWLIAYGDFNAIASEQRNSMKEVISTSYAKWFFRFFSSPWCPNAIAP